MADDLLSVELLLTCLVASLVAYFFFSSSRSRPSTELPALASAALEDAPLPGVSVGPMPPLPGAPHLLLRRDALVTKVRDCLVASMEEEEPAEVANKRKSRSAEQVRLEDAYSKAFGGNHKATTPGYSMAVLANVDGVGGLGASTAARLYVAKYKREHSGIIWWLDASHADSLDHDYAALAVALGVDIDSDADAAVGGGGGGGGEKAKKKSRLEVTKAEIGRALSRKENSGWLLVWDNCASPLDIMHHLPLAMNGHVIIASRAGVSAAVATGEEEEGKGEGGSRSSTTNPVPSSVWESTIGPGRKKMVDVPAYSNAESAQYLSRLTEPVDKAVGADMEPKDREGLAVRVLSSLLDNHPLSLAIAASYVQYVRGSRAAAVVQQKREGGPAVAQNKAQRGGVEGPGYRVSDFLFSYQSRTSAKLSLGTLSVGKGKLPLSTPQSVAQAAVGTLWSIIHERLSSEAAAAGAASGWLCHCFRPVKDQKGEPFFAQPAIQLLRLCSCLHGNAGVPLSVVRLMPVSVLRSKLSLLWHGTGAGHSSDTDNKMINTFIEEPLLVSVLNTLTRLGVATVLPAQHVKSSSTSATSTASITSRSAAANFRLCFHPMLLDAIFSSTGSEEQSDAMTQSISAVHTEALRINHCRLSARAILISTGQRETWGPTALMSPHCDAWERRAKEATSDPVNPLDTLTDMHVKNVAGSLKNASLANHMFKNFVTAERRLRRAMALLKSVEPAGAVPTQAVVAETLNMHSALALLQRHQGQLDESAATLQTLLDGRLKQAGGSKDSFGYVSALGRLAEVLHQQGKAEEARVLMEQILNSCGRNKGVADPQYEIDQESVGFILDEQSSSTEMSHALLERMDNNRMHGYNTILRRGKQS